MNRILYTLIFLANAHFLAACSEVPAYASETHSASVSSSHSVYIQNGVLKLLKENEKNILYVYIRPADTGKWLATGGGGGVQDKPWLFKSAASWTLGDENLRYTGDSPTRSFSFVFDSRNMTITTESGNYAVRKADIIVITLDSEWKTGSVKSGIESLRDFDLTDKKRQQLEKKIREYYTG